jgi:hypothetical protein
VPHQRSSTFLLLLFRIQLSLLDCFTWSEERAQSLRSQKIKKDKHETLVTQKQSRSISSHHSAVAEGRTGFFWFCFESISVGYS